MKAPLERLTLRRVSWIGPDPLPGDWLQTTTGRRYQVINVRGTILHCRVLPPEAEPEPGVRIFNWFWANRKRSA